jgi:hypothetical protein
MLATILVVVALFAIYGYLRPRDGCTHNCGMCSKTCGSSESNHE